MHPNCLEKEFKIVLIGGLDSTGGAGLQRDIEFFKNDENIRLVPTFVSVQGQEFMMDAMSRSYFRKGLQSIRDEWGKESVLIKVGAICQGWQLNEILKLKSSLTECFILFDPVLSSSRFEDFSKDISREDILHFIENVDLVTPNLNEFEYLTDKTLVHLDDFKKYHSKLNCRSVLIKGGHHSQRCDFFYNKDFSFYMRGQYIDYEFRGTGCSLGSLIIRGLSEGLLLEDAVVWAKGLLCSNLSKGASYIQLNTLIPKLPEISFDGKFNSVRFKKLDFGQTTFYPIISSYEELEKIVSKDIKLVQLRMKDADPNDVIHIVKKCKELCRQNGILLFLNDYWEIAIHESVDGVHLGFEDLQEANIKLIADAGLYLGVSSHCYMEGAFISQISPSYLALGPVYETKIKKMRFKPQGVEALSTWMNLFDYPIVAIGGIRLDNCKEVLLKRPDFVCAVQDINLDENPKRKIKLWHEVINQLCVQ